MESLLKCVGGVESEVWCEQKYMKESTWSKERQNPGNG